MSLLKVRNNGDAFISDVYSGTDIGRTITPAGQMVDETGGHNWTQMAYLTLAGADGFQSPYVLLYREDGAVYLSSMRGPTHFDRPVRIDQWEDNWTTITPWFDSGRLLLYRQADGRAFSANASFNPVDGAFQLSNTVQIGLWEQDWAHIVSYQIQEKNFLLLVRENGNVFIAPVSFHADIGAPDVSAPTPAGTWDTDWATITNFDLAGQYFLFFYKSDGTAFTAPIVPSGMAIATGSPLTPPWTNDWANILQVQYRQKIT